MHKLWRNFWFGMSPGDFLRTELQWTPTRRILTVRLFITLMLVCFISVTLRPPSIVALSFSFVMMLGPTMLDYTMTLTTAWKLIQLELIAIGLSILSLAMWGDQPIFLVPWSYGLITLLLFISRVTGTPTIPPMLYVFSVLYNPENPDQNVYGALWMLPTLGLLAFGTSIVVQLLLWPQDPETLLHQQLTERFDAIIRQLDRMTASNPADETSLRPQFNEKPAIGSVSRQFTLLAHAELAHPALKSTHEERVDVIVELDNGFNIAAKLNRILFETNPREVLSEADQARLRSIAADYRQLRTHFLGNDRLPDNLHINAALPRLLPDQPATLVIHRLEDATQRLAKSLSTLRKPKPIGFASPKNETSHDQPRRPPLAWLNGQFWIDNMDALHFGMKFALGVIICLFLVQAFRWPGIDTAILTCVIVAQTSLGADYRKSIMRIMGASLGGLLAYVFIIVLEPALETIAGFLLAIAPVCWLSAWVGSGSPRIAYIGTQIGYAFAHAVLPGYGPVLELESARDRVLGILLGITVVGVINYLIWPQHSELMAIKRIAASLRTLSTYLSHGWADSASRFSSAALMKAMDSELVKAVGYLEHAQIEPSASQPGADANHASLALVIDTIHGIARVMQSRLSYYANADFQATLKRSSLAKSGLDQTLAEILGFLADSLENKSRTAPASIQQARLSLENAAGQLSVNPAIDVEAAKSLRAFIDLDKILINTIEELESLIHNMTETVRRPQS